MENIEKRRARQREYNKRNRERLSAYRKNRYHTNEEFRKKCIEASTKWIRKKQMKEGGTSNES